MLRVVFVWNYLGSQPLRCASVSHDRDYTVSYRSTVSYGGTVDIRYMHIQQSESINHLSFRLNSQGYSNHKISQSGVYPIDSDGTAVVVQHE